MKKINLIHSEYAWTNTEPNPFQADGAELTDIDNIVERFLKTGELPSTQRQAYYMEHPQQDLNTVLTNMRQLQHDEELGYGASAPSQDDRGSSVTAQKEVTHGSPSLEPIVQPEAEQADSDPVVKVQSKKVPKG